MRVAYVCADRGIPLLGFKGASVHMREMAAALSARGNHLVVASVALGEGNPPPAVDSVVPLPQERAEQESDLADLIRRHSIDVVLERYSLQSGAARRASARVGLPLVLEVNSPLALEASRYRGLTNLDEALAQEGDCVRAADGIVVVSKPLDEYIRRYGPVGPVAVVPNGVDTRRFMTTTPARLGVPPGSVCVGFVGSMKPWHGISELIEAFQSVARAHPSAHLVLAGTGPGDAFIERSAGSTELRGRLHRLGPVPHEAVPGILAAVSLAVAPYPVIPDFYFSPIKVVEYMAAGLPVVFSAVGDLVELVDGGGIACPPGDVRALGEAIGRLVDDPALRRTMGTAARARIARRSWASAAANVESLLRSVASARVSRS